MLQLPERLCRGLLGASRGFHEASELQLLDVVIATITWPIG